MNRTNMMWGGGRVADHRSLAPARLLTARPDTDRPA